jgi:hypothetical protein
MSEERAVYIVACNTPSCLNGEANAVIITSEPDSLRAQLEELERRLIPLLITVQHALGKEPTVITRAQRRLG